MTVEAYFEREDASDIQLDLTSEVAEFYRRLDVPEGLRAVPTENQGVSSVG